MKVWSGWASQFLLGFLRLKSINVVFLLAYFMICLLVMNGFIARLNVRRVRVKRELQLPIHVGEEAVIQLTVSNIGTRTATVIVDDQIEGESVRWLVLQTSTGKASISCHARRVFYAPVNSQLWLGCHRDIQLV